MYAPYPDILTSHIDRPIPWQYTLAFPSQNILIVSSPDILTWQWFHIFSYPDIKEVVLSSRYHTVAIPFPDILTLHSDSNLMTSLHYTVALSPPDILIFHGLCPVSKYPDIIQQLPHLQISWHYTMVVPHPDILTLTSVLSFSIYPDITQWLPHLRISWHYTVIAPSPDPTSDIQTLHNGCPLFRYPDVTQWPSHFQISWLYKLKTQTFYWSTLHRFRQYTCKYKTLRQNNKNKQNTHNWA